MYLSENLVMMPPNQSHAEQRKILNKVMGPLAAKQYDTLIQDQANHLVGELSGFVGDPLPLIIR
jgi:cytochrome P450